ALVSSSKLSGPGFGEAPRRPGDPESAYDASFSAARFASPNAFSRNRSVPTATPDGSALALNQKTTRSATTTIAPTSTVVAREPSTEAPFPPLRPEHTVTMTVKAFAPTKNEVTQVVRKRTAAIGSPPRREPPPVSNPVLHTSAEADGPAIRLTHDDGLSSGQPAPEVTATVPNALSKQTPHAATQRVMFRRQELPSRMVASPVYGLGQNVAQDAVHADTVPTSAARLQGDESTIREHYEDTTPGALERTTPGHHEITAPGGYNQSTNGEITAPGGGFDDQREITTPGGFDGTAPHEITTPGAGFGTRQGIEVTATFVTAPPPHTDLLVIATMPLAMMPPPLPVREIAAPGLSQIITKGTTTPQTQGSGVNRDASPDRNHAPARQHEESVASDAEHKRVREMDALIARFASNVEVKTGRGRENTFLRKRSELDGAPKEDDYANEHTQPRHRAVEIRRENTEIIQRPLPPRKRR
ncbi:MAG: hypothetical protein H7Z43_08575, partial [Clostridia bacterium]|nr:hypothetical protein [Deltaproteobacteria bacterium]